MHRIDSDGRTTSLPAIRTPVRTPGYFGPGDPAAGQQSTRVSYEWCNAVQEEIAGVVEAASLTLSKSNNKQMIQAINKLIAAAVGAIPVASGVPAGTIAWFYGTSAPSGWLIANGATYNTTTYADLYAAIGANRLPDLRGEFVRGLDLGRGVDSGRILGSSQTDAGRNLTGSVMYGQDSDATAKQPGAGVFLYGDAVKDSTNYFSWYQDFQGIYNNWYPLTFDASRVWGSTHVAAEFRPRNIALLGVIKY